MHLPMPAFITLRETVRKQREQKQQHEDEEIKKRKAQEAQSRLASLHPALRRKLDNNQHPDASTVMTRDEAAELEDQLTGL